MDNERLIYLASQMLNFIEEELYEDDNIEWFGNTFGMTKEEYEKIKYGE